MDSPAKRRLRDFWSFYREYTHSAAHTAAAAALAIFGLLIFVDPWFAALAIASYVVPPVVLYVRSDESTSTGPSSVSERPSEARERLERQTENEYPNTRDGSTGRSQPDTSVREQDGRAHPIDQLTGPFDTEGSDGSSDVESVAVDTDRDGDTDSDRDDGDTDSDREGVDTDSDRDDSDTDSDREDGDTDSDRDDGDTDSDG